MLQYSTIYGGIIMTKTVKKDELKKALGELEISGKKMFSNHFTKYVVDYKIEDKHIKILSNTGDYRLVKNTRNNISKLNQAIVKNKVEIAKKIDSYEEHSNERLFVLIINILIIMGCGFIVPFAFFTGFYLFFLLSILAFSISVITTSISGFNYYILVKEIQSLKKITGYKKDLEFKFPHFNVKSIKSHN